MSNPGMRAGLRTRPSRNERLHMLLKRSTSMATGKFGTAGMRKRSGPRPITLAPVRLPPDDTPQGGRSQ